MKRCSKVFPRWCSARWDGDVVPDGIAPSGEAHGGVDVLTGGVAHGCAYNLVVYSARVCIVVFSSYLAPGGVSLSGVAPVI